MINLSQLETTLFHVCAYYYSNEIHLQMNDGEKSHKINENMNNAEKDFYFFQFYPLNM